MKSRSLLVCLVIGLLIVLCVPRSSLAAMRTLELSELTKEADLIVTGNVISIESRLEQGIFTFVTIKVDQALKGDMTPEVTVKVPGGEIGGIGLAVSDTPIFKLGEKVIVFLKGNIVVGLNQGKYTIEDNIVKENNLPLATFIQQIIATEPEPILNIIK